MSEMGQNSNLCRVLVDFLMISSVILKFAIYLRRAYNYGINKGKEDDDLC